MPPSGWPFGPNPLSAPSALVAGNVPFGHLYSLGLLGLYAPSCCFPRASAVVYGRKSPSPLPVLFSQRELLYIVYVTLLRGSKSYRSFTKPARVVVSELSV
jgi:hypothetical protein